MHHHFVEHVFAKAGQLQKAFGGTSPCAACGTQFKKQHMCVSWTQIAIIYLHLPPEITVSLATKKTLSLQCEVCKIKFTDMRHLLHHLRSHDTVIQDWVAARDSLGGRTVCAHCSAAFSTMSGLQYPIINGQCREFQETADTCHTPIDPALMDMFQYGHLLPKNEALDFATMTLTCLRCNRTFQRPGDLSAHLQTQHGNHLRH